MWKSNSAEFSEFSLDSEGPGDVPGDGVGEGKCLEMPEVSASMMVERSVGGGIDGRETSGSMRPGEARGDSGRDVLSSLGNGDAANKLGYSS
jgi:hypothetical protein